MPLPPASDARPSPRSTARSKARSTPDSVGNDRPSGGSTRAASSAISRTFESLSKNRAVGSAATSAVGSTTTEQPVTSTCASGLARRARRTTWRDLRSATAVTVQVLTITRSARSWLSTRSTPRARNNRSTSSISAWLTLQPRLAIAARRTGFGSAGGLLTARSYARRAGSPQRSRGTKESRSLDHRQLLDPPVADRRIGAQQSSHAGTEGQWQSREPERPWQGRSIGAVRPDLVSPSRACSSAR